jgi:anthranilate/para-aminobenzoate synthase component I
MQEQSDISAIQEHGYRITIRTLIIKWAQQRYVQAGAGIVAD